MNSDDVVVKTDLPFKLLKSGKVRDNYEVNGQILEVVTDRISAFDVVLPSAIPYKGACLTQLTGFWSSLFKNDLKSDIITMDVDKYPIELRDFLDILKGRSMLVRKAEVFPVECIVRGYISGSAWESYKNAGTVCGTKLPSGLKESEKFPEPLFTPSTKAEKGHDINISFEQMKEIVGLDYAEQLQDLSLKIYEKGTEYAAKRGIIIADTKLEFGKIGDVVYLVDEILTPDSSRFWPADKYEPGHFQPSFDKQYVRDWLRKESGWDMKSSPPSLPDNIVAKTTLKYLQAHDLITGESLIHKVA